MHHHQKVKSDPHRARHMKLVQCCAATEQSTGRILANSTGICADIRVAKLQQCRGQQYSLAEPNVGKGLAHNLHGS